MFVQLDQLQLAIIFSKKSFYVLRRLIIHDVQFWLESFQQEHLKFLFVHVEYADIVKACNWCCQDGVGFIMV
jgi:hypothetical protein